MLRLGEVFLTKDAKMMGWRIDDLAGLATAISYIISKKGKAPRDEVEDLLRSKLPGWRVEMNISRYIRSGYLGEDEHNPLLGLENPCRSRPEGAC